MSSGHETPSQHPEPRTEAKDLLRHDRDELLAMPQEAVVDMVVDLEGKLISAQGLNASLAQLQLRRDNEHAEEKQELTKAAEVEKEELVKAAEIDPLTGLLNKRAWNHRVEAMVESGEGEFGVIFIDLSKFKLVNDALGHAAGDEILQKTAIAVEASLRHGDDELTHDAGRYGGDEFAILCDLLSRHGSTDTPGVKLEKIVARLRANFSAMTHSEGLDTLGFDVAIGGVVFESGMTAEDLLKQADKAMYADKYARREKLTDEERNRVMDVRPILDKIGVRLPDELSDS